MTETEKGGENLAALFIHTGELLCVWSFAPVVTCVTQVPTSFPTIATDIFAVVVEFVFILANVALTGTSVATILSHILVVVSNFGSFFGGSGGVTVFPVLSQL